MPLQPIEPTPSAADLCAARLRAVILSEEWNAGDRLPPERSLAETLGVNRTTLRTALSALVQSGLVRVRQGSGYIVCDYRRAGGPGLLDPLLRHTQAPGARRAMLEDLLTVRRALAKVVMTRLAQGKCEPSPALVEARDRFRTLVDAGSPPEMLAASDAAFVRAAVEQTESPVFTLCLNPVESTVQALPELQAVVYADPMEVSRGHDAFLQWLQSDERDPTLLLGTMESRDKANLNAFLGCTEGR